MSFRILGLDPSPFRPLFGLPDAELRRAGAHRRVVDAHPGVPDRVGVRDLEIGETALLVNFEHLPVDTPYRSRHAIFVAEGASEALDAIDVLPEAIRRRPISLRAFDADGMMRDAALADGTALVLPIERFLADPAVAYLHAHFARPGCYAARIVRA